MRISVNWLAELVEIKDPGALPDALTFAGLEVERVEQLGAGLESILVARILSSQPHPKADRLSVTEIDAGGRRLQIVCGAKNYEVGDLVPLAPPGTVLPGGRRIEAAELRGVQSLGMLCSSQELGLALDQASEGLLILAQAMPGERLVDALPIVDTILDVNVTPNRADCLSHLGIAREVAALTGGGLRQAQAVARPHGQLASGLPAPRIEDQDRCGLFLGQPLSADGLHRSSPFLMRYRLQACGIRPIGLAVDVTNSVMLELGQPLHAYDLDKLHDGIVVRRARAGEKLVTLDGIERQLDPDDLLICDGELPIGLAGVMGGRATQVTETTRRLYLEAASFDPAGIRRTAKRHGLPSEASHRFERGVDPALPTRALARAVALLSASSAAAIEVGEVQAAQAKVSPPGRVKLRLARVGELLGRTVSSEEVVSRLRSVGVTTASRAGPEALFEIPSHRQDLVEAVDLIAEVGRLGGYAAIPAIPPRQGFAAVRDDGQDHLHAELRRALTGAGFSETVHYSFLSGPLAEAFSGRLAPVALVNPLGNDRGAMRQSLLPSLCQTVRANLAHLTRDAGVDPSLRLYEIARVYGWPVAGEALEWPARESDRLGLIWHGPRFPLGWGNARGLADSNDLRGLVERLFGDLRKPLEVQAAEAGNAPFLHPRSAFEIWSGGARLGIAGEIHPGLAQSFDLPRQLLLAELDLDALQRLGELPRRTSVPRFPAVLRDVAFVVAREVPQERLAACLREAGGELLESLLLFDVYEGAPLGAAEKSLAYSLRFRAEDRTLTDAEVARLHAAMVAAADARCQARLRST